MLRVELKKFNQEKKVKLKPNNSNQFTILGSLFIPDTNMNTLTLHPCKLVVVCEFASNSIDYFK